MTSGPAEQFNNEESQKAKSGEVTADAKPVMHTRKHGKQYHRKADSEKANSVTNLIVKFLPPSMTSEGLFSLFSEHGELESCKVATNKNSGASLGYGFVKYKTEKSAHAALKDLDGTFIQGKVLKVTFVDKAKKLAAVEGNNPKVSETAKSNIYIAGLPHTWTRTELQQFFANYGPVVTCKVLFDSHGESRNVGFVLFHSTSTAAHAIEAVNGTVLPGATEPAIVKYARDSSSVKHCLPEPVETHKRRFNHKQRHHHHHHHHPLAMMPMPAGVDGEAGAVPTEGAVDGVFPGAGVLGNEMMGLQGLGNAVRMPVNMNMGHHHRPMGYYGYPKAHKHNHNYGHGFNYHYDKTNMYYPHASQHLYNPQLLVGGMPQGPVIDHYIPVDVESYAAPKAAPLPQEKHE